MSKAHADLDTAIHNSAATEYDKGNILFLAEKYAESQTELLKRQLAAVDKRLRQGNRNARIDEQMMTNPTDTNQASEDELRAEILTEFKQVHKLAPADYTENCTNVVMSIIRTERLKLLAEVRERVVGEDDSQNDPIFRGRKYDVRLRNKLREEQVANLTKLEAEL